MGAVEVEECRARFVGEGWVEGVLLTAVEDEEAVAVAAAVAVEVEEGGMG